MYKIAYVDTVIEPQYKHVEVETMEEVSQWLSRKDIFIIGWCKKNDNKSE